MARPMASGHQTMVTREAKKKRINTIDFIPTVAPTQPQSIVSIICSRDADEIVFAINCQSIRKTSDWILH